MADEMDFKNCNEEQLWRYVATALEKENIETILVGGACVSVYSSGLYKSGDVDMIINSIIMKDKVPPIMKKLGFEREGRYFKHPECKHLFIEFPSGPAFVGGKPSIPEEVKNEGKTIKLLSPTDCIIDRIESYIYGENAGYPHGERKTLEQAVLVAQNQPHNIEKIRKYCESENQKDVFEEFLNLLKKK